MLPTYLFDLHLVRRLPEKKGMKYGQAGMEGSSFLRVDKGPSTQSEFADFCPARSRITRESRLSPISQSP